MLMGARERAIYLNQLTAAKKRGDPDVKAEEEATLAGSTLAAIRSWFRQVLHLPSWGILCGCNRQVNVGRFGRKK